MDCSVIPKIIVRSPSDILWLRTKKISGAKTNRPHEINTLMGKGSGSVSSLSCSLRGSSSLFIHKRCNRMSATNGLSPGGAALAMPIGVAKQLALAQTFQVWL